MSFYLQLFVFLGVEHFVYATDFQLIFLIYIIFQKVSFSKNIQVCNANSLYVVLAKREELKRFVLIMKKQPSAM